MADQLKDGLRRGSVRGMLAAFAVTPAGAWVPRGRVPNQIQDSWGFAAAMSLGSGNRDYRVRGMYIEFENVDDPDDVVTAPTYGKDEGIEYYDELSLSSVRDYLRVPLLTAPLLGIAEGYEDQFTPDVSGNVLTFFAQSSGLQGIHGKTYSDSVNSKVFGAALIVAPDWDDASKDIVVARTYLDPADQVPKIASGQVGMSWELFFLRQE
jgi:hypothetical protein